jgi:hypothetical protein
MPILLAAVDAILDPQFNLHNAGATPGWEPQIVVSGPMTSDLGFNVGTGMMRLGTRANSAIARFLHLYLRNVGGLRPGTLDMGSLGLGLNVVIAEDDAAVDRLGWAPYRVERGFDRSDDVVTVQSVIAVSPPIFCGGAADERLRALARSMSAAIDLWCYTGILYEHFHPLVVMSEDIATALTAAGMDKDDVRGYLFENLLVPAGELERYSRHLLGTPQSLRDLALRGEIAPQYSRADQPDHLVPMLQRPEWTDIVVGGSPWRNQAKVLINAHEQGVPVTRRVERPITTRS